MVKNHYNDENSENIDFSETEQKIKAKLNKIYDRHFCHWLKHNQPYLFFILKSEVIPKREKQLKLEIQIEERQSELLDLEENIKKSESTVKEKESELRFWEREEEIVFPCIKIGHWSSQSICFPSPWSFLNSAFDWFLKTGLTVVPILSLFKILEIEPSTFNVATTSLSVSASAYYALFSSVALIWLTSATICNLEISGDRPDYDSDKKKRYNRFKIAVWIVIVIIEAAMGSVLIAEIVNKSRVKNNLDLLNPLEWLEILLGISVYALINILFAVSKGRVYRFNTTKKVDLGKARAERNCYHDKFQRAQQELEGLKAEFKELEQFFQSECQFDRRCDDLAAIAMQGKEVTDMRDEQNYLNGSSTASSIEFERNGARKSPNPEIEMS